MYGAITIACWRRYSVKASLDQRPIVLTTSNGIPRRRYSSVPPMRMLWPLRLAKGVMGGMLARRLRNSVFVRGRRPFGCFHAKRGAESSAGLTRK